MSHKHAHRKHEKDAGARAETSPVDIPPRVNEPLRLVHHHAGYLRVRANAFTGTTADAVVARARAAAEATAGFRSWSHDPRTGSVVVQYEPGAVDADDLLKHIATSAGLSGVESHTVTKMNRDELVSVFMDAVQGVNKVIRDATGGRADLRELVPLALVGTAVVSFVLQNEYSRLPRWDSALYRGYRIFFNWHRKEIRDREDGHPE
jgi:hypothetical protein